MSNDKCFCHFNGYEVKDAKARANSEKAVSDAENAVLTAQSAEKNATTAQSAAANAEGNSSSALIMAQQAAAAAAAAESFASNAGNFAQTANYTADNALNTANDALSIVTETKETVENLQKNRKTNLISFANTGLQPVSNSSDLKAPCDKLLNYNIILAKTFSPGTSVTTNVLCYLSKENAGKIIISGVGCLPPIINEGHHATANVSVYIDGYYNEETGILQITNYLGSEIESYVSVPGEATGDDVHTARPVYLLGIYGIL